MRKILLPFLVMALAACSDHNEAPVPDGGQESMAFSAALNENATRSSAGLETLHSAFGVVTWKWKADGLEMVMLHNDGNTPYCVNYTGTGQSWEYNGYSYGQIAPTLNTQATRYWDGQATRYMFGAFAPWEPMQEEKNGKGPLALVQDFRQENAAQATDEGWAVAVNKQGNYIVLRTCGTYAGTARITGVTGNTPAALNWVVATHQRYITAAPNIIPALTDEDVLAVVSDPTNIANTEKYTRLQTYYDPVALHFHPIMSQTVFRVYEENGNEVELSGFRVATNQPIWDKADYDGKGTLGAIEDNWDYANGAKTQQDGLTIGTYRMIYSPDTYSLTVTGNSPETATQAYSYMQVPQEFPYDLKMRIGVRIADGDPLATGGWLYTDLQPISGGWQPGRRYVYCVKITAQQEIILLDVETEDWQDSGDGTIHEILTNW